GDRNPGRRRPAGLVAARVRRATRLRRHVGAAAAQPGDGRRGHRRGDRGDRRAGPAAAPRPDRRSVHRHRRRAASGAPAGPMSIWLVLAGMAIVTYLLRASFLLLPPEVETPPLLKRALRYVPAA